jgi:hypothetical protein
MGGAMNTGQRQECGVTLLGAALPRTQTPGGPALHVTLDLDAAGRIEPGGAGLLVSPTVGLPRPTHSARRALPDLTPVALMSGARRGASR